jgi:hypothetical protein
VTTCQAKAFPWRALLVIACREAYSVLRPARAVLEPDWN